MEGERKKNMYYLYILECADKTLYTGVTTDLTRRTKEHNGAKLGAKCTRARRPVKLVFSKRFRSRSAALKAESRIKKLPRTEKVMLAKIAYEKIEPKRIRENRERGNRIDPRKIFAKTEQCCHH